MTFRGGKDERHLGGNNLLLGWIARLEFLDEAEYLVPIIGCLLQPPGY